MAQTPNSTKKIPLEIPESTPKETQKKSPKKSPPSTYHDMVEEQAKLYKGKSVVFLKERLDEEIDERNFYRRIQSELEMRINATSHRRDREKLQEEQMFYEVNEEQAEMTIMVIEKELQSRGVLKSSKTNVSKRAKSSK